MLDFLHEPEFVKSLNEMSIFKISVGSLIDHRKTRRSRVLYGTTLEGILLCRIDCLPQANDSQELPKLETSIESVKSSVFQSFV